MHVSSYESLLVLAVAMTLVLLVRRLPLQNVLLAAGIVAGIVCVMERMRSLLIGSSDARPFWTLPLLWIVLVINARSLGRLLLRRWLQHPFYGFWVIGVAVVVASILEFILSWEFGWRPAGWKDWIFSAVTALLALVFATPALISKRPQQAPSHHSMTPSLHSKPVTDSGERCDKATNK